LAAYGSTAQLYAMIRATPLSVIHSARKAHAEAEMAQ